MMDKIQEGTKVRISYLPDQPIGEVVRVREDNDNGYRLDIALERDGKRILESCAATAVELVDDVFGRFQKRQYCHPRDFFLRLLSYDFPLENAGGSLSNSKTDLLPHQILLTHTLINSPRRRYLIADEVGLGKTIETGMVIREMHARGEGNRILVICPAGLTDNWQREMRDCFRMFFDVFGKDFTDSTPYAWEQHNLVIASVDTLKREERLTKLLSAPRWDCIVIDEAHHLSRKRYGTKIERTLNYKLAERIKAISRDLLFLTATPHQGDAYQFWSLIQLLDDQLFENPDAMKDHRGLLGRVMIRRTKREVTDADGKPIFMRRQVQTHRFQLSLREERYSERIVEYLKEGYTVAGGTGGKTTKRERAVGFLMATFQKIMSSSPRAIKQALRRRLVSLLSRRQMALESGKLGTITRNDLSARIVKYQEEMRAIVKEILKYEGENDVTTADADAHIAKLKQRLSKRPEFNEELTSWALDESESGDAILESELEIPNEIARLQELIEMIDEGPDRKFDTLIRAIEQVKNENPSEKIIIFTQYLQTLLFLRDELSHYYDPQKIALVRGGPLEDKIASCESFWDENGAQILLSTTAGGEGINLQVCRILFNYDLPWNPMAVEQRIGRIHRYGQQETAQVYNLVGEGTIEEKVYDILEEKLLDIAQTIGKVDRVTGQVVEDFRSEVLGYLGSNANYTELYRKALIDRDYVRTAQEITDALEKAREASEAIREFSQELSSFNMEKYTAIRGKYELKDLGIFMQKAVSSLGGSFIPSGEIVEIATPNVLLSYPGVSSHYSGATFSRKLATRKKGMDLLGIGHPLVDATMKYYRTQATTIDIAHIAIENTPAAMVCYYLYTVQLSDSPARVLLYPIIVSGDVVPANRTESLNAIPSTAEVTISLDDINARRELLMRNVDADIKSKYDGIVDIRKECVGILLVN